MLGNGGLAEPVKIGQKDDPALFSRQALERAEQSVSAFALPDFLFHVYGRIFRLRQQLVNLFRHEQALLAAAPSEQVAQMIATDGHKPAIERPPAGIKLVSLIPEAEEQFLNRFFGLATA
jgi:hypothetical protein